MIKIIISIIVGVIIGIFAPNDFISTNIDNFINIGLCLLLFFIGVDIGKNGDIFQQMKSLSKKLLLLPVVITIASLLGGIVSALVLGISIGEGLVLSAGMGWYSYSSVLLSKTDVSLGSIAFMANVFRELLAILIIPIVAKKIGSLEAISTAGAPSMDSALPVINKYTSSENSIIAFYSGFIITLVIPILLPSIILIFKL